MQCLRLQCSFPSTAGLTDTAVANPALAFQPHAAALGSSPIPSDESALNTLVFPQQHTYMHSPSPFLTIHQGQALHSSWITYTARPSHCIQHWAPPPKEALAAGPYLCLSETKVHRPKLPLRKACTKSRLTESERAAAADKRLTSLRRRRCATQRSAQNVPALLPPAALCLSLPCRAAALSSSTWASCWSRAERANKAHLGSAGAWPAAQRDSSALTQDTASSSRLPGSRGAGNY